MDSFLGLFDPNNSDETSTSDSDLQDNNNDILDHSDIFLNTINDNNNNHNNNDIDNVSDNLNTDLKNDHRNMSSCSSPNKQNNNRNVIIDFDKGMLPPEPQLGNIEYKLKLINPSEERFEHLVTQMKWRLREGQGEAIYEIGVSDSGQLHGLGDLDMTKSLHTLKQMARRLGATTTILRRKSIIGNGGGNNHINNNTNRNECDGKINIPITNGGVQKQQQQQQPQQQQQNPSHKHQRRSVVEILVRKIPNDQHNIEIRVAVLGSENAGKSTLIGCLTEGILDNGRGSARINMFRNVNDLETGHTTCISHETLGFDTIGNVINYKYYEMITSEEISDRSNKLVTFMDLAGHRRYMRKTVQALTGYSPHHAMLMIAADKGITQITKEHLAIVRALEMSVFIVITKIDVQSPNNIIQQLRTVLSEPNYSKVPFLISTEDDVLTAAASSHHQFNSTQIIPIFCISNVTGFGLDLITKFLYVLSPGISTAEKERLEQEPCEFQIDEIFKIGEIGPVVGGLLVKGVITENMPMKIGPLMDGSFSSVIVQSIHRNKAPCRFVRAGQSASLAFVHDQNLMHLRSGMVLLPNIAIIDCGDDLNDGSSSSFADDIPFGSLYFQASITVLYHTTAIYEGCQTTVHIGSIRQTAVIEGIMGGGKIRTNEEASVLFRFICHPEYVSPGMRILFREGTSKGIGQVTQVFPLNRGK